MISFGLVLATIGLALTNIAIGWALAVHFRHSPRRAPVELQPPGESGNVTPITIARRDDDEPALEPVSAGVNQANSPLDDNPLEAILPLQ
jgi:hypothetical protein